MYRIELHEFEIKHTVMALLQYGHKLQLHKNSKTSFFRTLIGNIMLKSIATKYSHDAAPNSRRNI